MTGIDGFDALPVSESVRLDADASADVTATLECCTPDGAGCVTALDDAATITRAEFVMAGPAHDVAPSTAAPIDRAPIQTRTTPPLTALLVEFCDAIVSRPAPRRRRLDRDGHAGL